MSNEGEVDVVLMNPGESKMQKTKEQFVRSVMRKGRTRAQAEGLWKGIQTRKSKSKSGSKSPARKPKVTTTVRYQRNPSRAKARTNPTRAKARTNPTRAKARRNPSRAKARSNPTPSAAGLALADGGGLVMAGANYGLDAIESLPNLWQGAGMAAGGTLLGALASFLSPSLGAGIAGGGMAIGSYKLLQELVAYLATPKSGGGASANGSNGGNDVGQIPAHRRVTMGAVQADLGAIQAELGSIRARLPEGHELSNDLGAIQAELGRTALVRR